jgi:hypothetical protein
MPATFNATAAAATQMLLDCRSNPRSCASFGAWTRKTSRDVSVLASEEAGRMLEASFAGSASLLFENGGLRSELSDGG